MQDVEGKVIVITGASSGIGRETARQLVEGGAKVVLSARREDRLAQIADELGRDSVAYLASDVTSLADMQAVVKLAEETFGKVDAVYANAGIMPAGNMSEGKDMVTKLYDAVAIQPSDIASAVVFAVSQPDGVDISDLAVQPLMQP